MSTVKENLIAAKALISDPSKWVKHSGDGTCFCIVTAIANRLDTFVGDQTPEIVAVTAALEPAWTNVMVFNDSLDTTHADIMALFDRAIAAQDGA